MERKRASTWWLSARVVGHPRASVSIHRKLIYLSLCFCLSLSLTAIFLLPLSLCWRHLTSPHLASFSFTSQFLLIVSSHDPVIVTRVNCRVLVKCQIQKPFIHQQYRSCTLTAIRTLHALTVSFRCLSFSIWRTERRGEHGPPFACINRVISMSSFCFHFVWFFLIFSYFCFLDGFWYRDPVRNRLIIQGSILICVPKLAIMH